MKIKNIDDDYEVMAYIKTELTTMTPAEQQEWKRNFDRAAHEARRLGATSFQPVKFPDGHWEFHIVKPQAN